MVNVNSIYGFGLDGGCYDLVSIMECERSLLKEGVMKLKFYVLLIVFD